ncbi:MAG: flavodoxin domain-containing protein [Chloroflexota bacterium]|jgi:menaquinone-dependent protoporphyrinogen oxidase|nr:flavodoxin domain-containing protein [Chloroflexota bacterium]
MPSVLIVHASRHGATAGIAERIAEVLQSTGVRTNVVDAAEMPDPAPFDACVIGGGVYMGKWVSSGTEFLDRFASTLATRPIWLFSSGPLPGSTKEPTAAVEDPIESALGPAQGPGSGGRRQIEELSERIHPRDHRVFFGAFDPSDPPRSMSERVVRMMPGSKGILPPGDFRDWPAIEAWARQIAGALSTEPVTL